MQQWSQSIKLFFSFKTMEGSGGASSCICKRLTAPLTPPCGRGGSAMPMGGMVTASAASSLGFWDMKTLGMRRQLKVPSPQSSLFMDAQNTGVLFSGGMDGVCACATAPRRGRRWAAPCGSSSAALPASAAEIHGEAGGQAQRVVKLLTKASLPRRRAGRGRRRRQHPAVGFEQVHEYGGQGPDAGQHLQGPH